MKKKKTALKIKIKPDDVKIRKGQKMPSRPHKDKSKYNRKKNNG